ncbi:MAG: hypothetical protein ACI4XE_11145, partial [Acutalibacteraceae bacterium]
IKLSADQPCVIFGSGKTFGLIQIGNQSSVDIKAGSEMTLKDSSGNVLYSATTPVKTRYVVFSSPDLTSDSTYNLYSDNTSVASATAQTGSVSSGRPGGRPGNADGCTCLCHSTGFGAIIWKILNVFFKIFGINQTCACGVSHY